jgi:SnoaL-like domain
MPTMNNPANSADLASRLSRLEAIEEIKNLKSRYLSACDQKQVDVIRDCFPDEQMVIDYGPVGNFTHREQLVDVYVKFACNEHVMDIHLGGNPQIEIIDDTHARGSWCLHFFQVHTAAKTVLQLGGYYADEYRKDDGVWKISYSKFQPYATELLALDEGLHRIKFVGKALPKFGE